MNSLCGNAPGTWNSSSPTIANHQIYEEFFDLCKGTYFHVQGGFKSLQSFLRRTKLWPRTSH